MMIQRPFHLFYSLLFVGMLFALSLPSLKSLTTFSVPARAGFTDGMAAHDFEQYYDRSFPVRTLGTNIWAAITYLFFDEGRPGVVIGRRGWLYTDEEFRICPDTEQQVRANLAAIGRVADLLARRHVRLVMAVVPAKARVYPEYLGRRRPAPVRNRLYNRLHAMLQRRGIPAPDLYGALSAGRAGGQVFFRTDTHWTPYGAEVAAHAVAGTILGRHLLPPGDQRYVTARSAPRPHAGDLLSYLPLDPWCSFLLPPVDTLVPRKTWLSTDREEDLLLAGPEPVVMALVGTSYSADPRWDFAGALRRELGRDLVNWAEKGEGPIAPMLRYLASDEFTAATPQLVLWEFPERYLPLPPESGGRSQGAEPGSELPVPYR